MRIAHLILTHSNPHQVERLINVLTNPNADFYIHVDLKFPIDQYIHFKENTNIFFIQKRKNVKWGSFSLVQATLNGFDQILRSGIEYSHINLLSGQDYPIVNVHTIHEFFSNHQNKSFMQFLLVNSEWQEAIPRLENFHLTKYNFLGKHKIEWLMNTLLPKRKMPAKLIAVGRSQWFTITPAHANYIMNYLTINKNVKSFFNLTWGSDEIIFQTILFNSPFKEDLINNNLRYIDWSEGNASPKTLTIGDAEILSKCGQLFARKFDEKVDTAILDYVDKLIL